MLVQTIKFALNVVIINIYNQITQNVYQIALAILIVNFINIYFNKFKFKIKKLLLFGKIKHLVI